MAYRGWQSRACRSAVFFSCSIVGLGLVSCLAVLVGVGLASVTSNSWSVVGPIVERSGTQDDVKRYSKVLYENEFMRDIANGRVFRRQKSYRRTSDENDSINNLGAAVVRNRTYRTVCVRLCDGYFFPISAATTRSRFAKDARACESRCSAETKLFAYPTDGGSPETMLDVNGRPYASLANAFLYRTQYDASCKCRPHPWEPDAVKAHQVYASADWQRKAKRLARISTRKFRKQRRRQRAIVRASASRNDGLAPLSANVAGQSALTSAPVSLAADRPRARRLNGGVVVRRETRSRYMALGVKARKVRRPRASQRSRKRGWKSAVYGNPDN